MILVCVFRIFERPPKRGSAARDGHDDVENVRMVASSEGAFVKEGGRAKQILGAKIVWRCSTCGAFDRTMRLARAIAKSEGVCLFIN